MGTYVTSPRPYRVFTAMYNTTAGPRTLRLRAHDVDHAFKLARAQLRRKLDGAYVDVWAMATGTVRLILVKPT